MVLCYCSWSCAIEVRPILFCPEVYACSQRFFLEFPLSSPHAPKNKLRANSHLAWWPCTMLSTIALLPSPLLVYIHIVLNDSGLSIITVQQENIER